MIDLTATRAQAVIDDDTRTIALCDVASGNRLEDALLERLGFESAHRLLYDVGQAGALAELYADVMTEDEIAAWWRAGGNVDDARDLVIARGLKYHPLNRTPTDEDVHAARVRIAAAIIADHRANQRISAGIASLADDVYPPPGWESETMGEIADLRRRIRVRYVQIAIMLVALVGLAVLAVSL
jgi:hypothetical protein